MGEGVRFRDSPYVSVVQPQSKGYRSRDLAQTYHHTHTYPWDTLTAYLGGFFPARRHSPHARMRSRSGKLSFPTSPWPQLVFIERVPCTTFVPRNLLAATVTSIAWDLKSLPSHWRASITARKTEKLAIASMRVAEPRASALAFTIAPGSEWHKPDGLLWRPRLQEQAYRLRRQTT